MTSHMINGSWINNPNVKASINKGQTRIIPSWEDNWKTWEAKARGLASVRNSS